MKHVGTFRGNPYHMPAGSPQGGQFTHGPVAKVKAATEHVTTQGHGAADTRKHHKAPKMSAHDRELNRIDYMDKVKRGIDPNAGFTGY